MSDYISSGYHIPDLNKCIIVDNLVEKVPEGIFMLIPIKMADGITHKVLHFFGPTDSDKKGEGV